MCSAGNNAVSWAVMYSTESQSVLRERNLWYRLQHILPDRDV